MKNVNEENKTVTAGKPVTDKGIGSHHPTDAAAAIAADKAKLNAGTSALADPQKKDAFNGKWQTQLKAAKSNWSKLSENELQQSGGVETNLVELVRQRYSLSQETASQQVRSFIEKCHC